MDLICLWVGYLAVGAAALVIALWLLDQAITKLVHSAGAWELMIDFIVYRKRFKAWMKKQETKE